MIFLVRRKITPGNSGKKQSNAATVVIYRDIMYPIEKLK
jgi:hypothetical protein